MSDSQIPTSCVSNLNNTCGCEKCSNTFKSGKSLSRYMKTDANIYVCEKCDKTFKSGKSLSCHMKSHTSVSAFRCDVCGTGFSRRDNLVRHRKRQHMVQVGGGLAIVKHPFTVTHAFNHACEVYTWLVNGYDPLIVMNEYKDDVTSLISIPRKWYLVLDVLMENDGVQNVFGFRNSAMITLDSGNICGDCERAMQLVLDHIESFDQNGSGWTIELIKKLELHTVKYVVT